MDSIKNIMQEREANPSPMASTPEQGFVIIPPTILCDPRLPLGVKVVFGRVLGFINKHGYCAATNEYLAGPLQISKNTFRNHLSRLYKHGYLRHEVIRDGRGEVIERRIYSNLLPSEGAPLVPSKVRPPHNPRTPEGTIEGNERSKTNVNADKDLSKSRAEVSYYAELIADKLGDRKSLAYYRKQCKKYDGSALLRKASEIVADGGARNPGAVFVKWIQQAEARS